MNILIVEDNPSVARLLQQATNEAGYTNQLETDGLKALRLAQQINFDLILLDVMLPGMDGMEVCRRLRAAGKETLILMITARDTTEDKVDGLDAGADDYVAKPFKIAELLARMRALLRRGQSSAMPILQVGDLTLDPSTRQAMRAGKNIDLSATEYSLLEYLMRHPGRVLTRSVILEHVWDYDFGGTDNVLDVYIMYLRKKIDKGNPEPLIHTVRGVGFRMGNNNA
jgi:two-component system OmpR family response regulator